MKIRREWAMPNKNTFDIQPIRLFVEKYLDVSSVSVDPFARNKRWATHTNDLNPNTKAEHHLDALGFLELLKARGVKVDLIIFDPPYSLEQCKRSYENINLKFTYEMTHRVGRWKADKSLFDEIIELNGIVLSFGWNSIGMGINRGYALEEMLVVCHGGAHNDTICIAERKTSEQLKLF